MTAQMYLCLGIFLFMMLGFLFAKKLRTSLAVVSICTIVLVTFSGIIPAGEVLSKFANRNILLIASMIIVSTGFSRTQAVNKLSGMVYKISNGNFSIQLLGYCFLAFLLTNLIPSPMAAFGVMVPVVASACKKNGISPSKAMYSVALVCICAIGTAPFGSGMYTYATANSMMESYGYTTFAMKILDPVKGQLVISLLLVLYAAFIAPKLAPSQPSVPITLGAFSSKAGAVDDAEPLSPVREVLGYSIFILTTLGLIFVDQLGLESWQIAMTGAALMAATGVLTTKESIDAIPVPTMLMLVAAYAAGGAMEASGLGDKIGDLLASALGNTRNGYIIGFAFFIVPFFMTQFMSNFSVDNLFQPIVIMAAKSLGCNPVGLLLILGSACNSAFMTPMSTGNHSADDGSRRLQPKRSFQNGMAAFHYYVRALRVCDYDGISRIPLIQAHTIADKGEGQMFL